MAAIVRLAKQTDSDGMLRLSVAARIKAYEPIIKGESHDAFLKKHIVTAHRLGNFSASLQKYLHQEDAFTAYVVEEDGEVRGYIKISISPDSLYISNLYVDPLAQGNGYGSSLIEETIRLAKGRTIILDVVEQNLSALRVYAKYGFKQVEARRKTFHGLPVIRLKRTSTPDK